jgi:hypothetical protein
MDLDAEHKKWRSHPGLFGLKVCTDSQLSQRVRGVRINGDLLRGAVESGDMEELGAKLRAIVPADAQLFWFWAPGGVLIVVPHMLGETSNRYLSDDYKKRAVMDAWMVGICSQEFDPIPEGGAIDWHDKELL